MFAIYDVTGRSFRDTLENLRKVKEIQATQRSSFRLDDKVATDPQLPASSPAAAYSAQEYREELQISEREAIVHAHQIMSFPVTTMQISLEIESAYQSFRDQRHHQLPVLDKFQRVVGMLTERNLLRFLIDNKNRIKNEGGKTVADAMSTPVIAADPVTDVRRIAKVMLEYRQSAVPITNDQDELIGLVSRSNILQAAASDPPLSLWTWIRRIAFRAACWNILCQTASVSFIGLVVDKLVSIFVLLIIKNKKRKMEEGKGFEPSIRY